MPTLYVAIFQLGLPFYRAKRSVARYCHDKLSVRLSVVTLVDCDHTR